MSRDRPRTPPWAAAAIVAVVGVAAATRFHELGRRSLWFDEGVTLGAVRLPLSEFLGQAWQSVGLNNQYLYYLALRPWHLLGEDEATLRAFSAVLSTGAVALTCWLGRSLLGTAAGLATGLLLAVHWFAIRMAQEARSYGLTVFLVCLSALFLARFVELDRRRDLAGWILAAGLALYAHFFAVFPIAAQVLSLAFLKGTTPARRRALVAGSLALLAIAAPVVVLGSRTPPGLLGWVRPVDAARLLEVGASLSGGRSALLLLHLVLFGVALARGLLERRPVLRWGTFLVLLWAALPPVALALLSLRHPVLVERYVTMSIPAWALVVGIVVGPLFERPRWRVLGLGLLAIFMASQLDMLLGRSTAPYEDWRTPARTVAGATRPGDAIIYDSPWAGLAFGYYLDQAPRRPENLQPGSLLFSSYFDPAEALARERVWVVLSRTTPGFEDRVHRLLSQSHPEIFRESFGELNVILFDVQPRPDGDGAFGRSSR